MGGICWQQGRITGKNSLDLRSLMLDYSQKIQLAQILHPDLPIEDAIDRLESFLADHELHEIQMTTSCPCGDAKVVLSVEELLDNPVRPNCPCYDAQWFRMQCHRCGYEYEVPEHKVDTVDCPRCKDWYEPVEDL
jgi:hypothetical protein